MKNTITSSIKLVLQDRSFMMALIGLLLSALAFSLYVGVAIQASELQVVVRYTSFGITNFYRDQWYYLITFIVFGALVAVVNGVLAVKLLQLKGRTYALFFIWLSIAIIAIAAITAWSVLRLAALS